MASRVAAERQFDDPRAALSYHPLTFGWICGELIKRIDGRSVGWFFAEEVARPLDLEVFIGLPADREHRVARLGLAETWGSSPVFDRDVWARDPFVRAVWGNPGVWQLSSFPWNRPEVRAAEIAGAGGIATALAMARLYGHLAELVSAGALAAATETLEARREPLLHRPQRFGIGFELQTMLGVFGPPPDAFGHSGAGGSVHGA
jgi:CubicO group peptidase (beta-lactamase class C family)